MKAIFEVKTIESDWAPPFKKNIYTDEYTPLLNEGFDRIRGNGNNEPVFKVTEATNDSAKVEFSSLFTIKNPGEDDLANKILFLKKGEEKIIAYLWGEKGITKKIIYKGTPSTFETRAMEKEKAFHELGVRYYSLLAESAQKNKKPGVSLFFRGKVKEIKSKLAKDFKLGLY